jgi:cyclopropane fatty-acyl-phospholipid synthase-like methyltransferase
MKDIHGQAILDYYKGDLEASLLIHNNYDEPEEMPVEVFFREEMDFSVIENLALIECKGKVLDMGAGAGAHSLVLQKRGFDVTALENSAGCIQVLQQSGVNNCVKADYASHQAKYDTILAMMNGIGLAGTLEKIPDFLKKCMSLLHEDGQLLIDSSDISYLYEDGIPQPSDYYGEVRYQYEYKGTKSQWFDWIYVDQDKLAEIASNLGFKIEVLHTAETDQYLCCITK